MRAWGHSRTARVEVRLSAQEQKALKARAATQGESVAEYVQGAVVGGEVLMRERRQGLVVREPNSTPSPLPRSADFATQLEQAQEARERWRRPEQRRPPAVPARA
jgi:uncharacterized protein (DUF1778 family)